jgi:hypothetical protein
MAEIITPQSATLTTLLEQKLQDIQNIMATGTNISTREDQSRNDLSSMVNGAIRDFLQGIKTSAVSTSISLVRNGNLNSSSLYNIFWQAVNNDLITLYDEAQNLGVILQNNHNYVMADVQNLLLLLKTTSAALQNYILLTPSIFTGEQSIVENFSNSVNIDSNSSLLTDAQANLDAVQGVVTLEITDSVTVQKNEVTNVNIGNANSNGVTYGTNTLLDTINSANFNLFQYELTSLNNNLPNRLVLDFTIKLNKPTILNFIRIVPNNFGTTTWPQIIALDLSTDGINLTSVRDEVLGDNSTDPNGYFTLAPSTSNYAGEGRYSFLPVTAQYVHFTIQQTTPYFDVKRNLFRWAIGIKDIELKTQTYGATAQLISNQINTSRPISQVSLDADELPDSIYAVTQLPTNASIQHDISVDDGMTWKTIAPLYYETKDPKAPNILYINSIDPSGNSSGDGHLNTQFQVSAFRHRLRMKKNVSQLEDASKAPYFSPVARSVTINVTAQEGI